MHNGAAHGIDGNMESLGSPDSLDSDFATPGGVEIMATSSLKFCTEICFFMVEGFRY